MWSAVAVALWCCCLLVSGANVEVWLAASGTNGDGSQAAPFTAVPQALTAVDNALSAAGNVVSLIIKSGTYNNFPGIGPTWSANFTTLIVRGELASDPPVLDGAYGDVGFIFYTVKFRGIKVEIRNIKIMRATRVGSGVLDFDGTGISEATVDGVTMDSCVSILEGALSSAVKSITISNSLFKNNTGEAGSAIFTYSAHVTVISSTFDGNNALNAGTLYLVGGMTANIEKCKFMNNNGKYTAGIEMGLIPYSVGVNITDCLFKKNLNTAMRVSAFNSNPSYKVTRSAFIQNAVGFSANANGTLARFSKDTIIWRNNPVGDVVCIEPYPKIELYVDQVPPIELCQLAENCAAQNMNWDRCFVCGGNDTCLGCDGIPFSGKTDCTAATVAPQLPESNTEIVYTGTDPDPLLLPKGPSGNTDPRSSLAVHFGTLREVRPDGSLVKSYDLDTLPFFVTSSIQTIGSNNVSVAQFEYYFSTSNAGIIITQGYYPYGTTLSQGGVDFDLNPQTLKISVEIDDWPFEGGSTSTNYLELKLNVQTGEGITNQQSVDTGLNGSTSYIQQDVQYSTSTTKGTLTFLNFAEFTRGVGTPSTLEVIEFYLLANESSADTNTYVFKFPGYCTKVLYDPNFSIVITVSDEGDGDDTSLGLIIGLSVGIPLCLCVVLIVVVVGIVAGILSKRRMREKLMSSLSSDL